jgi:hypothetical protein
MGGVIPIFLHIQELISSNRKPPVPIDERFVVLDIRGIISRKVRFKETGL